MMMNIIVVSITIACVTMIIAGGIFYDIFPDLHTIRV